MFSEMVVIRRVWILATRGCVEYMLEIAFSEDSESDAIKKEEVRGEERFKIDSRQSKMACSSVVNIETGFL